MTRVDITQPHVKPNAYQSYNIIIENEEMFSLYGMYHSISMTRKFFGFCEKDL